MEQGFSLSVYTELLAHLPGLHWWQSMDGNRYAYAPSCLAFSGQEEELSPPLWQERTHPQDQGRRTNSLLHLKEGEETSVEYRILTKTGNYQWVQECVRALRTTSGDLVLLSSATTCKEPVYRSMFNNSSHLLALMNPAGELLEMNEAGQHLFCAEDDPLWGQSLWQTTCLQATPALAKRIQQALEKAKSGQNVRFQDWVVDLQGRQYWGDFLIRPLLNGKGQLEYLLAEVSDITPLKRLDQQLRSLVNNLPDVVLRFDPQLRYVFVNNAIEQFTGHPPEHYIGKSKEEAGLPLMDGSLCLQKLKAALATKETQYFSSELSTHAPTPRHISSLVVPELNEQHEVTSLLMIMRDISSLVQQQAALRKTSAKLRALIEGSRDLICALDLQKRPFVFNSAYADEFNTLYGLKLDANQPLDQQLSHLPAEQQNLQDIWNRALRGEEFTILQEFGRPELERNYYELSFSSVFDETGQLMGASSIIRNLSRERRIEKELKDAQEFLILAENLPQIVFTARPNGHIDYLNQTFKEYTNQAHSPAEEVDWKRVIHPEDEQPVIEQWFEAIKHQAPGLQLEVRLRNRWGLYRWHIARAVPLYSENQQLVKWIGIISDIHEAKMAGERERIAAEEFKTMAESLPHIVWTTRSNGEITYFNSKWFEYTGQNPNMLGEPGWIEFLHPEDKEKTAKAWKKAVKTRGRYQIEYRLRHKSGRYRWFLAKGTPVEDPEGNLYKWFGTCTDIHENKLQRKRLQTQNERLNQINQYLDNFVHAAAHDLRSPVANMKGLLQLMQAGEFKLQKKIMESMESSLYRLDNTLQAMIHSIELQSLRQSPARKLNLQEVFEQVRQEFTERLQAVPHEIHTSFDECPDLNFIPFYLESLFRNLLSNAIKYRKEGQMLSIDLTCQSSRTHTLLKFSDNGIGIDLKKYKSKLFRPFQRFTNQAGGKGIGLHLINNIVTKTGGRVEVESEPDRGTTFLLYLKEIEG